MNIFFFIPLLLQIQFKLQMFLIKIAQTNLDITDNYFQLGEEKKNTPKGKKNLERTFKLSTMGLKHSPSS